MSKKQSLISRRQMLKTTGAAVLGLGAVEDLVEGLHQAGELHLDPGRIEGLLAVQRADLAGHVDDAAAVDDVVRQVERAALIERAADLGVGELVVGAAGDHLGLQPRQGVGVDRPAQRTGREDLGVGVEDRVRRHGGHNRGVGGPIGLGPRRALELRVRAMVEQAQALRAQSVAAVKVAEARSWPVLLQRWPTCVPVLPDPL